MEMELLKSQRKIAMGRKVGYRHAVAKKKECQNIFIYLYIYILYIYVKYT